MDKLPDVQHRHHGGWEHLGRGSRNRSRLPTLLATFALTVASCGGTATTSTAGAATTSTVIDTEWDYVSLGSSFTGWASWPETYASFIEEDLGVDVTYYDKTINRAHSDAVLDLLRTDEELRHLLANAEVITIGAFFSEDRKSVV